MDFDYGCMNDAENIQQEQRIGASIRQPQKPLSQQLSVQEPPARQRPPVKPRRSLKLPKTTQTQCLQKVSPPQGPGLLQPPSPALRAQTLLWFQKTQLPRLSQPGDPLPSWLHGFATRREAEDILKDKPQGCFLLRLSESKIGFVLSYRGKDRCRHFIIEEEEGGTNGRGGSYLITGEDSHHGSLADLVSYYTQNPVGPYDEMLTTPCDESDKVSQENIKQWGYHASGVAEAPRGECGDYKANPLSSAEPLISETGLQPSTGTAHTGKDVTAEYAIVRKVLRKSHSLPESQLSELSGHSLEPSNMNLSSQDKLPQSDTECAGACGGEDSIDVQYAKVRKPPKVVPKTNISPYMNVNNLQVHQRAPVQTTPLPNPSFTAEPGYRQLERVHTYEKTPCLLQQGKADQQMAFHSMGPGQDHQGRADSQSHLYSEVNLQGRRDCSSHITFTDRTTPSLPSRPPPSRAIKTPPHPDSHVQPGGEPFLLSSSPSKTGVPQLPYSEPPLSRAPGGSMYKRISDRPISSRPPLPPPNPKRN